MIGSSIMAMSRHEIRRRRFWGALCLIVLISILIAGLWPFHAPYNQVNWLTNENGLHFGKHGSIVSSGLFHLGNSDGEGSCSIEMWTEPEVSNGMQAILGFYDARRSMVSFLIGQYFDALMVDRTVKDQQNHSKKSRFGVRGVFRQGRRVFVTVTTSRRNTSVYVDGALAEVFPNAIFSINDLNGQIVIANSPIVNDSWSGRVLGLAVYNQELTSAQVAKHYSEWMTIQRPVIAENETPIALYLFNEHSGNIVHNHSGPAPDLLIPQRYFILHAPLLRPLWQEFRPSLSYFEDVGINLLGFVPLGFAFCAYWSSIAQIKRPLLLTMALGLAVSLTIEVLQAFLPTRSSGTTDLITNGLGSVFGAIIYSSFAVHPTGRCLRDFRLG
jgi:hypothetical protein